MADQRISDIDLDEKTLVRRNPDIERERRVAADDLVAENTFHPLRADAMGYEGPYRVRLSVPDGRLSLAIATSDGRPIQTLLLGLARFRRSIREYFAICESYFRAVRNASQHEIETTDMARRGVHDAAARLLMEALDGKVDLDFATARRLFTLICVLHIKG